MKKFLGNIKKKTSSTYRTIPNTAPEQANESAGPERRGNAPVDLPQGDSPEAVIVREVVSGTVQRKETTC
jgi:hypothetical protein